MADVKTTLSLEDQITPKLNKIYRGLDSLERVLDELGNNKGVATLTNRMKDTLSHLEDNVIRVDDVIKDATNSTSKWSDEFVELADIVTGINQASELLNKVVNGMKQVAEYSDELTLLKARLDLITDTTEATGVLQEEIYRASQQSRSSFLSMSNTVAQLGLLAKDAFGDTSEITDFAESLNKIFKISGLNDEAVSSVMYNLTQSLASGRLLGQDYRIIKQNGAKLINYLKSYYGVTSKELDKMVENGQVSSEDIKNAVLTQVEDINQQFNTLPITFEAAMQRLKNTNDFYFSKINERISKVFNSNVGQRFFKDIDTYLTGFYSTIDLILKGIELLGGVLDGVQITDNVSVLDSLSWIGGAGGSLILSALEAIGAAIGIQLIAKIIEFGIAQAQALGSFIKNLSSAKQGAIAVTSAIAGIAIGAVGAYNTLEQQAEKAGATARDFFAFMFVGFGGMWTGIKNLGIDIANLAIWVANQVAKAAGWVANLLGFENNWGNLEYIDRIDYKQEGYENMYRGYDLYDKMFGTKGTTTDEAMSNSVSNIEDAVTGSGIKIAEEDLQLLKNVAATEFVNRYTTLRPSMEVTFGDVRETADVDALEERIAEMMENALAESLY